MLGETQATTGFKPRVLWIGEDFVFSKKIVMDKHILQGVPKTKQPGSNLETKDEK